MARESKAKPRGAPRRAKKTARAAAAPRPAKGAGGAPGGPRRGGRKLIVVESPAKARTIARLAGRGYDVVASNGHVRDLPKSKLGVDVERDFAPQYLPIRNKSKTIRELRDRARGAEAILLATDPDREGEAIAWHLTQVLGKPDGAQQRLVFHEITSRAIHEALAAPREIDMRKVDAQQGRRILDRLVGYQLSPLLWRTVRYGLSAGRVQSVALRLIVDREREIAAFVPVEYWTVQVEAATAAGDTLRLALVSWEGRKPSLPNDAAAQAVIDRLGGRPLRVAAVRTRRRRRFAPAPFITSTLQQEAFRKLHWPTRKTMQIAQQLYEGLPLGAEGSLGLITYMRTDSTRVAAEALSAVREHIAQRIGADYLPAAAVTHRSRRGAQEAHEAIRPTEVGREPATLSAHLTKDQLKLYTLIWRRFVASQMRPQELDVTSVEAACEPALFRASGSVVVFDGFTRLYEAAGGEPAAEEEPGSEAGEARGAAATPASGAGGAEVPAEELEIARMPLLREGEELAVREYFKQQHFTEPPPRYTEGTLIRVLEERGIGRPSTYATIVTTILTRDYVRREKTKLCATELGCTVVDLLVKHFADVMSVDFTAHMEEELDRVAEGRDAWVAVVREFYAPFQRDLAAVEQQAETLKASVQTPTDERCEQCAGTLVRKFGRHGPFLACSNYPTCRFTRPYDESEKPQPVSQTCPACGGPMLLRHGRFGRFLACARYPECKTTLPVPTGVHCPQPDCPGELVEKRTRRARVFYGCNQYPRCDYAVWDRPVPRPCPSCSHPFLVERATQRDGAHDACPACKTRVPRPVAEEVSHGSPA